MSIGAKPLKEPVFDKLTAKQVEQIQLEYIAEKPSLRSLAAKYRVSHENIRKAVQCNVINREQAAVYTLFTEKFPAFLELIKTGVSPNIAASMFNVSNYAYNEYVLKNSEVLNAINAGRAVKIADAEKCLASAASTDWKAALKMLQAIPETRNQYSDPSIKQNNTPSISISMSWNRDESSNEASITIDNDSSAD